MLTLALLAFLSGDCVITWADSHTLAIESYKVIGNRVEMTDRSGDVLVARTDQIDLEATAETCPPKAAPVKAERRGAVKKPLSLVEAAELAASLPHAGAAGFATIGSDYAAPAAPSPDAGATVDRRATATADWGPKLSAMRSRYSSLVSERGRLATEHDRLVDAHNTVDNYVERDIDRKQIADLRTKIADVDTRISQLRSEYVAAQEEARTSGAMASAWRDAIDGGAMSN